MFPVPCLDVRTTDWPAPQGGGGDTEIFIGKRSVLLGSIG